MISPCLDTKDEERGIDGARPRFGTGLQPRRVFGATAIAASAMALLVVVAGVVLSTRRGQSPAPAPPASAAPRVAMTVFSGDRLGGFEAFAPLVSWWPTDRFAQADGNKLSDRVPGPATAGVGELLMLDPPFSAVDARSFAAGAWTVSLADSDGPSRDAVCLRADDAPFACGLHARAAITNIIGRTALQCRLKAVPVGDVIEAQCSNAAGDIAHLLAREGWLRPAPNAIVQPAMAEATSAAQARRVGMWAGGWRYRAAPQ